MKNLKRCSTLVLVIGLLVGTADAQLRYGKLGIGPVGSFVLPLTLDFSEKSGSIGGGLSAIYSPWEYVGLKAIVGIGQIKYNVPVGTFNGVAYTAKTPANTMMVHLNGYVTANFMPNSSFNPFLGVGAAYAYVDARTDKGAALQSATPPNRYDFTILGHGGFDIFLDEFFSVTVSADYGLMQIDVLEGYTKGGNNDAYARVGLEIKYYFFDQDFLTRLLEALKKRYER